MPLRLASLGHTIYFAINFRSNSEQNFESFSLASLGHAIYFGFNLWSNSEQKFEFQPRFARLYMQFIFASTRAKIRELLPPFARPCEFFWLQSPVECIEKTRAASLLLTIRAYDYFGFNLQ